MSFVINPDEQSSELKQKREMSIEELYNQHIKGRIYLNAPYQRNFVWKDNLKANLIKSIVLNRNINTIHVAEPTEECDRYEVIDGKQRITTILDFLDSKFSVPIIYNNVKKMYKWQDIIELASKNDKIFSRIRNRILEFSLQICVYDVPDHLKRKQLFEDINYNSKPLTVNEKIYCKHYECKQYIYDIYINIKKECPNLFKYISKQLAANNDNDTIRLIHKIIESVVDKESGLISVKNGPDLKTEKMYYYAESLEEKIKNADYLILFNTSIEKIKSIFKILDKLVYINKPPEHTCLTMVLYDVCVFLTRKIYEEKIFTISYISETIPDIFFQVIVDYSKFVIENKGVFAICREDVAKVKIRQEKLDEFIKDPLRGIDVGIKNKEFSSEEKLYAKIISQKDGHVDHDSPKSKSSTFNPVVISASENLKKSNKFINDYKNRMQAQ